MFNLFGSGKNYSIGIDFGTSAIKVIELSSNNKNQRVSLENYGWVDLGLSNSSTINRPVVSESQTSYNKKLQKYLQKLIKSMKLKSREAYISLPGSSGLVTTIDFPEMKSEELEEAIKFEAKKYIPIPLEEVALDWEIIKRENNSAGERKEEIGGQAVGATGNRQPETTQNPLEKKNEVLLVAAPKNEVIRCGNLIKESGLNVRNVELELFSLVRAIIGKDPGCFVIIDVGSRITNIILVDNGIIRVNRNIEGGGNEITNIIADSLNISKQRAEELKKEEKDLINNREMSLSMPVLDVIANESLRIINVFKEKKKDSRVDGIILSGGSSKLMGLDKYFEQKIGIKTNVVNPWRRVSLDEKLEPFVSKMGASFSVALGLALRGINKSGEK